MFYCEHAADSPVAVSDIKEWLAPKVVIWFKKNVILYFCISVILYLCTRAKIFICGHARYISSAFTPTLLVPPVS